MAELSIAERVANGVKWLDEQLPEWPSKVSVAALDISSPCCCILGQLFGNYAEAPEEALWRDVEHGCDYLGSDRGFNGEDFEYRTLTDEWRRVVTERRVVSR